MSSGDTILIVKIHKDGSVLESRIEHNSKLQSIFSRLFQSPNSAEYYEVKIILEANGLSRRNWHHGRSEMDRSSFN